MSDQVVNIIEVSAAVIRAVGAEQHQNDISLSDDAKKLCSLYGGMIYHELAELHLETFSEPYKILLKKWLPERTLLEKL